MRCFKVSHAKTRNAYKVIENIIWMESRLLIVDVFYYANRNGNIKQRTYYVELVPPLNYTLIKAS